MNIDRSKIVIRTADDSDARQLQDVRRAAFAPVFASFRAILGKKISEVTQARDDEAQAEYLASLLLPGSGWELYVAEHGGLVVGFVSIQLNRETSMGEIGLNDARPCEIGMNSRDRPKCLAISNVAARLYTVSMSKLEIIHLGHPKLRHKSLAVTKLELKTKRFQ